MLKAFRETSSSQGDADPTVMRGPSIEMVTPYIKRSDQVPDRVVVLQVKNARGSHHRVMQSTLAEAHDVGLAAVFLRGTFRLR